MPSFVPRRLAPCAIGLAAGVALCLSACSATTPPRPAGATAAAAVVPAVSTHDEVLASASVGDDAFVLLQHGKNLRSAASLQGGVPKENDVDHNWSLVTPSNSLQADEVTRLDGGFYSDEGVSNIVGQIGSAVTGVEVITTPGSTTMASISNGFFAAAWKGDDLSLSSSSIVVHLQDGSSRTIPYADVRTTT